MAKRMVKFEIDLPGVDRVTLLAEHGDDFYSARQFKDVEHVR